VDELGTDKPITDKPATAEGRDPSPLANALDALWTRFLPEIEGRVATLEAAAQASRDNDLSAEKQDEAHDAAHKLAGVLGTFGLTRGTVLARELEMMYSQHNGRDPSQVEQLAEIAAQIRAIVASRK
jgi:HPt (histidine-containing phosphotransfer) domain-containing protein